ncbi:MAG: helix-turn-helix domain-containing protein [Balneolaceae bacterium]
MKTLDDREEKQELDRAFLYLNRHLSKVHTVSEWAALLGMKRNDFSRQFRNAFYMTPHKVLAFTKLFDLIKRLENQYHTANKNYSVAVEAGFNDEKKLYNFIRYHLKCSPTDIRNDPLIREKCLHKIRLVSGLQLQSDIEKSDGRNVTKKSISYRFAGGGGVGNVQYEI